MSNFELIEDYLTHRLGTQEQSAFEQQLNSDPALKADVELQRHIIEGVKKARGIELKAMLNQVPLTGAGSTSVGTLKIAAALVAAGVVSTAIYFYTKPEQPSTSTIVTSAPAKKKEAANAPEMVTSLKPTTSPESTAAKVPDVKKTTQTNAKPIEIVKRGPAQPAQPKIDVVDPSAELTDNSDKKPDAVATEKSNATVSHIAVESDASTKAYTFHYQFSAGKLILYGSFDKALYEILEINGEHKTLFLFYKGNYYLLNEKETKITPLAPIHDAALLKKLKEYRN